MIGLEWVLAYLGLGVAVGFMAGLLGVGGGTVMVPVLTALFLAQGVPTEQVIHVALGTSMAAIILTSVSSLLSHHRKAGVVWPVVRTIAPGILLGTFGATFLAAALNATALALIFSMFIGFAAVQMFLNRPPKPGRDLPGRPGLLGAGAFIGGVSALVSIGGGSLSVPYLVWHNVNIKRAIGTAAAIGLPIALAGTAGYIINGLGRQPDELPLMLGFVHVPAVLLISVCSMLVAPVGARLAVGILKRLFALLLLFLSISMLLSVL